MSRLRIGAIIKVEKKKLKNRPRFVFHVHQLQKFFSCSFLDNVRALRAIALATLNFTKRQSEKRPTDHFSFSLNYFHIFVHFSPHSPRLRLTQQQWMRIRESLWKVNTPKTLAILPNKSFWLVFLLHFPWSFFFFFLRSRFILLFRLLFLTSSQFFSPFHTCRKFFNSQEKYLRCL